ncbi:MAG: hypothetical protein OXB95_07450 [Rhodobacteraceae bacterium]|nr:hypothetical protein [Paracoccaceae bacterium]
MKSAIVQQLSPVSARNAESGAEFAERRAPTHPNQIDMIYEFEELMYKESLKAQAGRAKFKHTSMQSEPRIDDRRRNRHGTSA